MTDLLTQDVVPSPESYRLIPLTQNKVAIVDESIFDWLNQWKWYAHRSGKIYYAMRRDNTTRKCILLHREVISAPAGSMVDHINRDGLDCRLSNLRIASPRENCRNRSLSSRNTSGIKGVVYSRKMQCWKAAIVVGGRSIHLGYHKTKEDAAIARSNGELLYFGANLSMDRVPVPAADLPSRPVRKNSTGLRCIFAHKNGGYFVTINTKYIGYFSNKRDALRARNNALRASAS